MRLDELVVEVETDGRAVSASAQRLATEVEGQRVERLGDLGVLVGGDLRVAEERHVVTLGRRGQQARFFFGLEAFARQALGARVPAHAVLLERPVVGAALGIVEGLQALAAEAGLAGGGHGPFDAPLVFWAP